jgi:hypothetical protein
MLHARLADGFHFLRLAQGFFVLLKLAGTLGDFALKVGIQFGKGGLGPCALAGSFWMDVVSRALSIATAASAASPRSPRLECSVKTLFSTMNCRPSRSDNH